MISLTIQKVRVGKWYAVYIPKRVTEGLKIREVDTLILEGFLEAFRSELVEIMV